MMLKLFEIRLHVAAAVITLASLCSAVAEQRPNLLFVFADQWRGQATGYAGDPNLLGKTPHLDRLAKEGVNLVNAVSTMPVCTPYRASLLTGQYALSHGLFMNDAPLNPELTTIGKVYKAAGYDTAYVGKWHIDGHGRSAYIPEERRHGFDYWKVLECTHNYNNNSAYYAGNDLKKKKWEGYDAIAQTRDMQRYIIEHAQTQKPFMAVLSWGAPHDPYNTAPAKYKKQFPVSKIQLRPNVPAANAKRARKDLAGYYAHIIALDECLGDLMATLDEAGIRDNTILVFTSDHGDMLYSHSEQRKQQPYDESTRVPLLVRYPARCDGREIDMPIGSPDIMPTLLGLSSLPIPEGVEGSDYSRVLTGESEPSNDAALIECITPFGSWHRGNGGREYRGLRTRQYTYARDLKGPWLLFDNKKDPYQTTNLVDSPDAEPVLKKLDAMLTQKLAERSDEFMPGEAYIKKWGYKVDGRGTIPYIK
ncbi:sulfatase [Coraliomargarita algicola]|uniref:Sulfatase n=1 Tax=Coraliomargarita algicola TaxID=3092156 RepID=A0ABZ0RM43_9BACT|nr:sulfatase [Coraliomargarita sp. J2-16]WPJ97290.1 sulfatase [Coraliomargarita sp. J2-16]